MRLFALFLASAGLFVMLGQRPERVGDLGKGFPPEIYSNEKPAPRTWCVYPDPVKKTMKVERCRPARTKSPKKR